MKLSTLYKSAKAGDNVQWSIETKGDQIIETYGRVGGKMQTNTRTAEPTNIGRSNERNAKQQAEFEATAKWKKKNDEGYREDQADIDDVPLLPMLASKFQDRKNKVSYPVFIQPKLDGNRAIVKPNGDIISRGGKPYNVPHISAQVKALKLKYSVDGELYIHGVSLQNIISYVKKNHGDRTTEKLNLVIYDVVIPNMPFVERNVYLANNIKTDFNIDMEGQVARLKTVICANEEGVYGYEGTFVQEGYEGAIVRTFDLDYESNHRSNNLMKVKSFLDDEFEVVGFKSAENGKVIWTCLTKGKDKSTFDCYHKCDLETGRQFYNNGKDYVGRKLTVKYFTILESCRPQFPIGIAFRDEKDLS